MNPLVLSPNLPRQFYRATGAAAAFRHTDPPDEYRPEEWLASITSRFGATPGPDDGLTRLPDGRLLRDAVAGDPVAWLGPEHVERFGSDAALLVKVLDAGQRLPVHVHPSRPYALQHLGSHHGKTEAWAVQATTGAEPVVWVGFQHDVDDAQLAGWMADQDVEALLGALHRFPVGGGDTVLIPAGVPHAIGEGVMCLELQEPTDFSLNLEWTGFDVPDGSGGQLGLPADVVRECVRRRKVTAAELDRLRSRRPSPSGSARVRLFPEEADPFFRAERLRPDPEVSLEPSFAVLVVVAGEGQLGWDEQPAATVRAGDCLLMPWSAGAVRVSGPVEVLRCLPPAPSAG